MKAFASDFDGTIYFMKEEPRYRQRDLDAIRAFQKQGMLFGACSGRSLQGICLVADGFIDFDFYILANGSLILDKEKKPIHKTCISRALITELYEDFKDRGELVIQANDTVYNFHKPYPLQTKIDSMDDIPGDDIYGMSFMAGTEEKAMEICDYVAERYQGRITAYPNRFIVDMVPYGCSKGQALAVIREYFQLDEIGGIGDSFNDIPLMQAADVSFTFDRAPASVQAEADHIVADAAEALEIFARK